MRILLSFLATYLLIFLGVTFLNSQFADSNYVAEIYSSMVSSRFPIIGLSTLAIILFVRAVPKQTIIIESETLQIEQGDESFSIDKAAITKIEDLDDVVIIEVGKQKYQLSKDINNFDVFLMKLTEARPLTKHVYNTFLHGPAIAAIIGFSFLLYGILDKALEQLAWPDWIVDFLPLGFITFLLFSLSKIPPYKNLAREFTVTFAIVASITLFFLIIRFLDFISYRFP